MKRKMSGELSTTVYFNINHNYLLVTGLSETTKCQQPLCCVRHFHSDTFIPLDIFTEGYLQMLQFSIMK